VSDNLINPIITTSSIPNTRCIAPCNGSATATPTTGTSPYTYIWNNSQTSSTATGLCLGTYSVTVTDSLDCNGEQTVVVSDNLINPIITTSSIPNTRCIASCNGSATATPTTGTSPYTYIWNNGQTSSTATALCAGTYTVILTDALDCTRSVETNVIEESNPVTTTITTIANTRCIAPCNGIAIANPTTGTSPYTYEWSNGQTSSTANALCAGSYTVTVTDALDCTVEKTAVIIDNLTIPTLTVSSISNTRCAVPCNGNATANPIIGTTPFTFKWNNNQSSQTAIDLCAGTYKVTATDALDCTVEQAIVIIDNLTIPSLTTTSKSNTSCINPCNGSSIANPSLGKSPYTYQWSNGQLSQAASALCAGSYTVIATDSLGCSDTATSIVSEEAYIITNFSYVFTCLNNPVIFTNTGITDAGATYLWNFGDGIGSSILQNPTYTYSKSGEYNVILTTTLGTCQDTYSSLITATPSPEITIQNVRHATCNKICDGIINVSVTGGVEPYTYLWDNGIRKNNKFIDLCPGSYTITVTDATGCTDVEENIVIWEPDAIDTLIIVKNASCNKSNGEAEVKLTGGCGHYAYEWKLNDSTLSFAPKINGLSSGMYHLLIRDICEDGGIQTICEFNDPIAVIIHEEGAPKLEGQIGNVSCNREGAGNLNVDDNGFITLTISEGQIPYYIQWNNGERDAYITHLTAGTYTVTVTDRNNCIITSSYTITEPEVLNISLSSMIPVSCAGGKDGQLKVYATGGTWFNGKNHYTYLWGLNSTVNTDSSMYDLEAGKYSLTVTDANNCIDTFSYRVIEPTQLQLSVTIQDIGCNGEKNGSANISVIGGTPAYKYFWNSKDNVPNKANLKAGNYVVTVTDANNCYDTISFNILESSKLNVVLAKNTPDYCERADGIIELVSYGGTAPYTYDWIPNVGITDKIVNLESGNYKITVTDSRNCSYDTIVTIESKPCPLEIPNVLSPNSDGANDVFCIKYIEQYKNVKLVIFNRWGNEIISYNNYEEINNWDGRTQTSAEITDGVYFYIITLNDGVTLNGSVTVIR